MALRIAIIASGSGSNAEAIMRKAKEGVLDVEVVCVISNRPGAGVLARANDYGVPAHVLDHTSFVTREAFDAALVDMLRTYEPEYIALAGYMRLLTPIFLGAFPGRVLNIHPALSPSFPGAHGQRDAHEYGVKIAGCTVHFVDEKMDHGAIIIQAAVPVPTGETVNELKARILALEHRVYPQALQWLAQGRLQCQGRHTTFLPDNHISSKTKHDKDNNTAYLVCPPLEDGF